MGCLQPTVYGETGQQDIMISEGVQILNKCDSHYVCQPLDAKKMRCQSMIQAEKHKGASTGNKTDCLPGRMEKQEMENGNGHRKQKRTWKMEISIHRQMQKIMSISDFSHDMSKIYTLV